MADRIKGITIEIDGQTTGLKSALSGITSQSISIQKELTDVQRLLKFDPGNSEALVQKQSLLAKQVEITSEKLLALKNAESQVEQQFKSGNLGEEQYRSFQREIAFTEASLDKFKIAYESVGTTGQASKVSNDFKTIDGEIKKVTEDEKKLSAAEGLNKLGVGAESAKSKISGLKTAVVGIGATVAGGAGLFAFSEKAIEAGDNAYKLSQKLHLTTAESAALNKIFTISGTDSSAFASTMTRLDKSILGAGESGNSTTKMLERYGVSLTDTSGKILPMNDQLEALATAYKKSADAGEEDAFSAEVLGNKGASLIPLLENYTETKEAASKVKGAFAIDPEEAHKTEEELKVLKLQVGATAGILAKAFIPFVEEALPPVTEAFKKVASVIASHKSDINSFIQTIIDIAKSVAGTVQPIIEGIFNFISEHGETVKDIVLGISAAFLAFEGINKIISGITSVMKLWESATIAITAAQEALDIALDANPIGVVVIAIGALIAIFAVLYKTNDGFRDTANQAWEQIKSTIGEAIEAIKAIIADFVVIAQALWAKYGDQITKIATDVFNNIKIVIQTVMNFIKDWLKVAMSIMNGDWKGAWEGIKQGFIDVWGGLFDLVKNTLKLIFDEFNLFTGGLLTSIGNWINNVIAWFADIPNKASTLWTNITTAFSNGWSAIVTFFTVSIPAWLESMGTWFMQLPGKIAFGLGEAIGSIIKWGTDTYNYLTTNVPIWINNVVTFFSELPSKIWEWLVQVVTKVGEWGSNVLNYIATNVPIWINNVVTFFSELPSKIWEWLVQVVTKVGEWGSNMLTESSTGMGKVFDGIVNTFTNLPSKMLEIGGHIVDGLKNGIKDAWEGMTGWIGGLCDSFIDGVKEKMDINSPSRVMRKLGVYTGEGFGLGIGDTVNSISKQANAIADAAIPNVNAGTYDMGINSIGSITGSSGTTNSLDAILAKMDSMTNAMANMQILMDSKMVGKLVTPAVSGNLAFNSGRKGF